MPLLPTTAPLDPKRIIESASALSRGRISLQNARGEGDILAFTLDGSEVLVAPMGVPVPGDEAAQAVKQSWMWQKPDADIRLHANHAIVTASRRGDPIRDATNVMTVSAAVLHAHDGKALYWGSAGQVVPAELVQELLNGEASPVMVWVGLMAWAATTKAPRSIATQGLAAFGHRELEVHDSHRSLGDLRMAVLDLATYVLEQDVTLKDGETIGPDADTKWPVCEVPSRLDPSRTVLLIGIP